MHKSSSKSEKPSSYENGSKFTEQNVEKLSRKMEQFEKILSKLDDKISLFESKSKKNLNENTLYDRELNYKPETENNSKFRALETRFSDNKDFVNEKLEEQEKKIRLLTKRLDEMQDSSHGNNNLERRLANIEKQLEKIINVPEKLKSKDFETNGLKLNNKGKDFDLSELKFNSKGKNLESNEYKINNKSSNKGKDLESNGSKFHTKGTDFEPYEYKINSKAKDYDLNEYKINTRIYEEIPKEKSVSESKKKSLIEYTKPLEERDSKGSRDLKEMKERLEKRDKGEKLEKSEKREKNEKNAEKMEKSEKTERNRNFLESEDFLKNESKYSQIFNKINTERPYLFDGQSNNAVLREQKQNSRTYTNNIQYNEDFAFKNVNRHSKTHSFYLSPEEEVQKERKKSQNSLENLEKQEKRKKIDEEIDKRLNLENEKRQKIIGNIENKKKIEEKLEDYNNSDDEKFRFTPFSTEKSRTKEIASRLKLENKMKDDKITKISYNILNK